jgi:hypothetical protein
VNISPQTTLGQIIIKQGLPQGYWSVTLPRGANMKERASSVLRAEGIDPEQVQFLANPNDFSEPERAIIESGGEVDGWSKS